MGVIVNTINSSIPAIPKHFDSGKYKTYITSNNTIFLINLGTLI